jgi:hypothetical protein
MQEQKCRRCGSQNLKVKKFELRHVNSRTMKLNSSQKLTELECRECDWMITLEDMPAMA